jgi:hypothetical protein
MRLLHRLYRWINILSLDVAVGAVVCASFFSSVLGVHIKPYGLISLGLTVWIIYTVDHLLDARRVMQPASTERHRFHQRFYKILIPIVALAVITDAIQIFFIRKPIIIAGIILGVLVVLYFFVQRYLIYFKEMFGALLYAGGVLLAPVSSSERPLSTLEMLLMLQFTLTALINLLLFTWFDRERDLKDKHQSFTTIFGEKATLNILAVLFILNASVTAIFFKNDYLMPAVIMAMMNMVLLLILLNRKHFEVDDRYRMLGDAVFLLPLIYFLL